MRRSADGASRSWASRALPAVLALVLVAGIVLLIPDGSIVGCERDGHFQRAGQLSCGLLVPNAPYGPLLPWLVAPLVPLVGTPYLATRILSLVVLLGLTALSWRAARTLGAGPGASALAALMVGLNGPMLFYGTMACSDLPATGLFVAACWLVFRSVRNPGIAWPAALAGLALAGACLVRVQYYLPAAALLLLFPLLARRARAILALWLGFALPVLAMFVLGWWIYGDVLDALNAHLGLSAYTRNLVRAGTILGAADAGSPVVPLGDRLLWSVFLVLRVTGGLPLVGGLAAAGLALARPRWRGLLVFIAPALVLYAGLAWSHPPPDWGARRFYLYLVPLCAVPSVLMGRAALRHWAPASRVLPRMAALVALAWVVGHGLWEIRSFRAPEPLSLLRFDPNAPRGLGTAFDRAVVRQTAQQAAGIDACVAVATNFHGATIALRNAWFLGDIAPDGSADWVDSIPLAPDDELWLLWVEPGGGRPPSLRRVLPPVEPSSAIGEGP